MFKKLRRHLYLQRRIQHEVLETLATICLYLDHEGHNVRNPYSIYMRDHFESLKILSEELRDKEK